MLEQLQKAYQAALGNVVFVDFKRKKVIKEASYETPQSRRIFKAHDRKQAAIIGNDIIQLERTNQTKGRTRL